jgi:hypothetical protein
MLLCYSYFASVQIVYIILSYTGTRQFSWPPHYPAASKHEDPDKGFMLPASPWTYENGSFNPDLEPSNAYLRSSSSKRRNNIRGAIPSLPPYHPDYREGNSSHDCRYEHSSSEDSGMFSEEESDDEQEGKRQNTVRRGSEGYEVRPVGREELLRRYLEELGEEPGRYQRYIPKPDSDSEEERESDSEKVPIAQMFGSRPQE